MASEQVLQDARVIINAFDLSAYVQDVTLNYSSESQDVSVMGTSTRKHKGGVYNWSLDIKFLYDKSTSGPEASLFGLQGTTACVEYRPLNVCSSANNPIYSGVGTIFNGPIGGNYGTMLGFTTKMESYSALSRASSS